MESTTKSVSFAASASDRKYERIQTQISIEEDSLAASPIEEITTTKTTRESFLRRRSSIVTTEQQHTLSTKSHFENDDDLKSTNHSRGGLWEYASVLSRHPSYRAYLASHLCQQLGDHFVRIANVLVVEELAMKSGSNNGSGSALAHVTLARLLPNAVFALVGGVLADKLDKRRLMVNTDCISGVVVLGYLLAMQWESLGLLYGVTIVRNSLSATYYPSASGILPDLVTGGESSSNHGSNNHSSSKNKSSSSRHHRDLQLAVTLNSWAWGGSVIVGGLLAGKMAAVLGLEACYFIDCVTYWMSAVLIAKGIKPDYNKKNVTKEETNYDINNDRDAFHDDDETSEEAIFEHKSENRSLFGYLMVCGFGWMVFAKPSASLVWGIEDIVGAQFATVFSEDGTEDTVKSSVHMGLLFSTIGLGCSIGPILLNTITDARKPYTLQRACWIGLMLLGLGWLLISFVDTFPQFLMGSFIRTLVRNW